MYDTRDDLFIRPATVLQHFRIKMEREVRQRLIDEFEKAWKTPIDIKDPSEFQVVIWFDQIFQTDIVKFIEKELTEHGWKNHSLTVHDCPMHNRKVHVLECRLEANDAVKYSRP